MCVLHCQSCMWHEFSELKQMLFRKLAQQLRLPVKGGLAACWNAATISLEDVIFFSKHHQSELGDCRNFSSVKAYSRILVKFIFIGLLLSPSITIQWGVELFSWDKPLLDSIHLAFIYKNSHIFLLPEVYSLKKKKNGYTLWPSSLILKV